MARVWSITALTSLALVLASTAAAQARVPTHGSTQVQDRGSIETTGEVIFNDIRITPNLPSVISSTGSTNVTVVGDEAVSLSVPQSFEAISVDGEESIKVVTTTTGQQASITNLESLMTTGNLLSVDVGGAIQIVPLQLAPNEYQGLMVVVAQYN